MSIANWTDRDYAQAAIDMLPDDPYAIGEFLRAQGIRYSVRGSAYLCPVNQWVQRWIDGPCATVRYEVRFETEWHVKIPAPVTKFISKFDAGTISLAKRAYR